MATVIVQEEEGIDGVFRVVSKTKRKDIHCYTCDMLVQAGTTVVASQTYAVVKGYKGYADYRVYCTLHCHDNDIEEVDGVRRYK